MNYKETLYFVAKCLTISHEKKNLDIVSELLKSETVDWDAVVKLSTGHFVYPALYCNLKRAGLLEYLPNELIGHMEYITELNRDRNLDIIQQAKEVNHLLVSNNITPIFLKGTANLLQGLYGDIVERMVGDIDLIVSENDYEPAINLLKQKGYTHKPHLLDNEKLGKHYPRMTHQNKIAAMEVHFRMIKEPYDRYFNYSTIKDRILGLKDEISILSYEHQVLHTIFNKQTNDLGYWHKTISLRNCYDLFLVSKKTNTLEAINSVGDYVNILNSFLASCHHIFNGISSIKFINDKKAVNYVNRQIELLETPKKLKWKIKKWDFYFLTKSRLKILKRAWISKNVRTHLYNKIFGLK